MEAEQDIVDAKCRNCGAESRFDNIVIHEHVSDDETLEEYSLVVCRACNEVSLFYREDVEIFWNKTAKVKEFNCLWPIKKRFLDFTLPKIVEHSYFEAVNAEKSKLYLASSVMIGRTIEAVCKEYDPKTKSIFKGLEKMLNEGALSQEMYDWGNELRILRNRGAHANTSQISEHDVKYAIDFLESMLSIIYDIRPKFKYIQSKANN